MIPGLSNVFGDGNNEVVTKRMQMTLTVMKSMTDFELDHAKAAKLFREQPSRSVRLARGAGVHPSVVEQLLQQYGKFSEVIKKMGGIKSKPKGSS